MKKIQNFKIRTHLLIFLSAFLWVLALSTCVLAQDPASTSYQKAYDLVLQEKWSQAIGK